MSVFGIEAVSAGPRTVVLRVCGVLDARAAPALLAEGRKVTEQEYLLVLNLAGVTFVSSSGVGSVLALVEEAPAGSVRLAELSDAVRSVITLLNLDPFLAIHLSEADAIRGPEAA
jgi:anti-anti-sigma factor